MTGFTKWDAFRRTKRRSRVCDDALEHCAGGPESIAGGTGSAGETLPNLLATCLQLHQATRDRIRGSRGPHSGFFALLLERRDLETVRREKGRLRSYLLVSLKHFLTDGRYRAMTIKRGEGRRLVPLDALGDSEGADLAPTDILSADQIYERRWALTVLEEVLTRLGEEYRSAGNAGLFERLKKLPRCQDSYGNQTNSGGTFTQVKKLTASDGGEGDQFGWSAAYSNHTALVGAYQATVGKSVRQGAAYFFERTATPTPTPSPTPTATPTP